MRNSFSVLFFLVSFSVFAQNDAQKLEDLQKELDNLQYEIGSGHDVEHRKINELIETLQSVKHENDSLKAKIKLLESELMLANMKLNLKQGLNSGNDSNAVGYVKMSEDGSRATETLNKGNYVVISSHRTIEESEKYLKELQEEYPKLKFMIAQNIRKTWYHISIEQPFSDDEIGHKVYLYRENGFKDAWHQYFD